MCLPMLAAVPALISSAGAAIGGAAAAIPGFASIAGAAKGAFAFAKTAKGISSLSSAFSAGSSLLSYMGQGQQGKAQEQAYRENKASAIRAYQGDIVANQQEAMIAQEQATQRREDVRAQGIADRAAANVALGENGIGGFTAAAIQQDLLRAEGTGIAAIDRNENLAAVRSQFANRAAGETARGRIGSVARGSAPSLLQLGLGLGSSALGGMKMFGDLKKAEAVT